MRDGYDSAGALPECRVIRYSLLRIHLKEWSMIREQLGNTLKFCEWTVAFECRRHWMVNSEWWIIQWARGLSRNEECGMWQVRWSASCKIEPPSVLWTKRRGTADETQSSVVGAVRPRHFRKLWVLPTFFCAWQMRKSSWSGFRRCRHRTRKWADNSR